jgi:hypothetical protein
MTLSEYLSWLSNTAATRCLLCELQAYSAGQKLTFRISNMPYYTLPTDSPANTQYEVRLTGDVYFTRSIPFFEKGRGVEEFGAIQVVNIDGVYDIWQNYLWKGMQIKLLLGDPSWPYANFNIHPLLIGTITEKPSFSKELIEFKIRDKIGKLDIPIQNTLLTTGDKKGEPSPLIYGVVRNIEPIQIDPTTLNYKYHTGIVNQVVNVYDKAVVLAAYTSNLTTGEIVITNRPAGTITMDVQGAKPSGTWLSKAGEITKQLLLNAGIPLGEIDTTALTTVDSTKEYTLGIYITEKKTVLDILDEIWSSVGGYYYFDFNGLFTVGLLTDPVNLTSKSDIYQLETVFSEISVEPLNEVQYRTSLKYQRNWRTQKDSDLAGSISDPNYPSKDRVEWLKSDYRVVYSENLSLVPQESGVYQYHLVNNPEAIETLIDDATQTTAECTYRQTILGGSRKLVKFTAVDSPFKLLPGDCITIHNPRYGLNNGQKVQILKISYHPLENKSEVEAWF